MDRLLFKNIDPDHKPLTTAQRVTARKAKKQSEPRAASTYRGAKRNARSHAARCNASAGKAYRGSVKLNRSCKWKYAETYHDARDLSQSNREVV